MFFTCRSLLAIALARTAGAAMLSSAADIQSAAGADARALHAFDAYVERFNRTYKPDSLEFLERFTIFRQSLDKVEEQNNKPKPMWTAGLNLLSDRTHAEIRDLTGWRGLRTTNEGGRGVMLQNLRGGTIGHLPKHVDYLDLQTTKLSHIRHQACGDCWAAATAAQLEAHAELHLGKFRKFSEGEINRCTENPHSCGGSGGCGGSTSELALHNALLNGLWQQDDHVSNCPAHRRELDSKSAKPPHEWGPGIREWVPELTQDVLDGVDASLPEPAAPAAAPSMSFGMYAWERLEVNRMLPMMHALIERGPISVAVSTDWHNYGDGIFDGCSKDAEIAHAVLLIGYGREETRHHGKVKFWLIQNSWGSDWGQDGKFKLLRTHEDERLCGIDHQPELGTTCAEGPAEVEVCGPCGLFYDTTVPHLHATPEAAKRMAERQQAWHEPE